jgi:hypothetical protein
MAGGAARLRAAGYAVRDIGIRDKADWQLCFGPCQGLIRRLLVGSERHDARLERDRNMRGIDEVRRFSCR